MKVYAGVDPLSGKRLYLTESVPAGLRALAEAKKVRTRLIGQIDEQRNPRTRATVNQLMDRYLDVVDVGVTTRARYEGVIRLHVRPLLGELPVSRLSGETIDAFHWIAVNPLDAAEPPRGVTHNPHTLSPQQAAARHRSVRDGPAPLLRHRADLRRVDVRTAAGRLGHGGGGTTTLRTYAAWVAEADQRAAGTFDEHMPALPVDLDEVGRTSKRPGRGRRAGRETRTSASRPTCVPRSPAGRCDREIIRRPWKPWPHAMAWRRALRIEPSPNSTRMDW